MKSYTQYIFFFLGVFFSFFTHAQDLPEFITLPANNISEHSAIIRGQFDRGEYANVADFPMTWFEYGPHGKLDFSTPQQLQMGEGGILFHSLRGLESATKYSYRTVIEVGGSVYYGERKSFTTLAKKKVSQNTSSGEKINNGSNKDGIESYSSQNTDDEFNIPSLSDFLGIRKKNKKTKKESSVDKHLVHQAPSKEELEKEQRSDNKAKEEKRKKDKKSAAYDDGLGTVIQYNPNLSKNKNVYTRGKNINQTPLNYPILIIIILLLLAIVVLSHFILKKKHRVREQQSLVGTTQDPNYQPRYHIPVKRDLHDPQQNPNTTFFRKK